MTKDKIIKLTCFVSEAIFGTIAVASILEQHPYLALMFLALARGSAAAKEFMLHEKP